MNTAEHEARENLINRYSSELIRSESPEVVLLVGSTSRGIATSDSDIDIAIFKNANELPSNEVIKDSGIYVNIERHCLPLLFEQVSSQYLDMKKLREAGRYFNGRVLFTQWEFLDSFFKNCANARLDPLKMQSMLRAAEKHIYDAKSNTSLEKSWWELIGAAIALTRTTLCLTPGKFQKPKWEMFDIFQLSDNTLVNIFIRLYKSEELSPIVIFDRINDCLLKACSLLGYPGLILAPDEIYEYRYMHRTWMDALSLFHSKDTLGSVHTAVSALQQMSTLFHYDGGEFSSSLLGTNLNQWACWMNYVEKILIAIFTRGRKDDLHEITNCLEEYGKKLGGICRQCYDDNKNILELGL